MDGGTGDPGRLWLGPPRPWVLALPGASLGLPFCKRGVEAHGGSLGVDSDPGAGSCFWFRIPRGMGAPDPEEACTRPRPHEARAPSVAREAWTPDAVAWPSIQTGRWTWRMHLT